MINALLWFDGALCALFRDRKRKREVKRQWRKTGYVGHKRKKFAYELFETKRGSGNAKPD